jgi:hypothetical protein
MTEADQGSSQSHSQPRPQLVAGRAVLERNRSLYEPGDPTEPDFGPVSAVRTLAFERSARRRLQAASFPVQLIGTGFTPQPALAPDVAKTGRVRLAYVSPTQLNCALIRQEA